MAKRKHPNCRKWKDAPWILAFGDQFDWCLSWFGSSEQACRSLKMRFLQFNLTNNFILDKRVICYKVSMHWKQLVKHWLDVLLCFILLSGCYQIWFYLEVLKWKLYICSKLREATFGIFKTRKGKEEFNIAELNARIFFLGIFCSGLKRQHGVRIFGEFPSGSWLHWRDVWITILCQQRRCVVELHRWTEMFLESRISTVFLYRPTSTCCYHGNANKPTDATSLTIGGKKNI